MTITATDNSTYQATNPSDVVVFSHSVNIYAPKVINVTVEDDETPPITLTATVDTDDSVDLSLANGPSNWWYKVNTGSCTAASGTSVTNITGAASGSNTVKAYSDSACSAQIATASFTTAPPGIVVSGKSSLTVDEGSSQNVSVKLSKQARRQRDRRHRGCQFPDELGDRQSHQSDFHHQQLVHAADGDHHRRGRLS